MGYKPRGFKLFVDSNRINGSIRYHIDNGFGTTVFTKNVNRRKARLASKIKDIERVATAETLWTALVIPVLSLATTSRKLYIVKTRSY